MSYRLHRKSRPQADVEIFGGPLHQKEFDGGMNIDVPASEIRSNEVAYAANVICREYGIEPRPGCIKISTTGDDGLTTSLVTGYVSNPLKFGVYGVNYRNTVIKSNGIRFYGENPANATFLDSFGYDYTTGISAVAWAPGTGDSTMIPYRRGFIVFNAAKITYTDYSGSFQINAPNPVHGIKDDVAAGTFKYRYLLTLTRIDQFAADGTSLLLTGGLTLANRLVSGIEVSHESGSNGKTYNNAGTSTARQNDYGDVYTAAAISVASPYALTNADLKAAFSTAAGVTNNLAAAHFSHVSIYRTRDIGTAGLALGNNKAIFYWVADVRRYDVIGGGAGFSDTLSDDTIQNQGIILKTQGFDPMPSGSCAEVAGGWMFVADRTNVSSDNYLHYCAISNSPENFGYYFKDIQKWRFNQGIRAMRANQDVLSIFCSSSSHICNMTSFVSDASKLQSIPFLNYFHAVDRSVGIKDWATLDSVDENTMIAVCSDNTVRLWDTTRWGDDLAYNKVSSEIKQIVPASVSNYEQGSVGKYYNGAYYLWYSKNLTDTATTSCLRYGMGVADTQYAKGSRKQAGFGWTFNTNWVQPNFKRGVQVVDETQGVQRLIVIHAATGKFYWADTFLPFVGALDFGTYQMNRYDTDFGNYASANADGIEIASSWKFRELIGSEESDTLIHDETFNRWRPMSETTGYRSNQTVSMSAYIDGSITAAETVTNQPRAASVKFTKEISGRRVQLAVATDKGGWKYVGVESHFRSIDRTRFSTAGDNSSSESTTAYPQYQAELATNLTHWVTRRETGVNCATGLTMTASGVVTTTTGPDLNTSSGYLFNSSTYVGTISNTYAGDFSLSLWVKSIATGIDIFSIAGTTAMTMKFNSATILSFSGLGTVTVSTIAAGWHHFFIKRVGSTISVYQNTVLKGTITSAASLGGGVLTLGLATGIGSIADFRVYSDVKTDLGMAYYYNDVTSNAGAIVMPQV